MAISFCKQLPSFSQNIHRFGFVLLLLLNTAGIDAQDAFINSSRNKEQEQEKVDKSFDIDSLAFYQTVKTYVNPVLPGDHPDPTLLKVGDDFYHSGSSFHFTPYLPIYHSKDLIHWEVISRVVPPSIAGFVNDRPSAGIWQGAITYFYDSYWIYFSSNGQWFSKAKSPYGPW